MASIKVDADGIPYWDQPVTTHWDYTVDWTARMLSVSDAVVSAVWSVGTAGLAVTSVMHTSSGVHMGWCQPSAGVLGASFYLTSKIFTAFGRVERAKIKVNVVA